MRITVASLVITIQLNRFFVYRANMFSLEGCIKRQSSQLIITHH